MTARAGGYLIGLDLGTQSIRALLADTRGGTVACARRPTPTRHIGDGSADYDPDELWSHVVELLRELAGQVPPGGAVAGIACASMGESCVLVDRGGGALAPAMAWFDRRTEADGRTVEAALGADRLFEITGYPPDPTLSLCKILWIRRTRPEIFARARRVLPIASWIAFRLCGVAAVDPSLASRTLCLDTRRRDWSGELLEAVGIDRKLMPPILPSGTALGPMLAEVLAATGLPGTPIVGVGAQDHICGGFLAGATRPGVLLDSLGTSEALLTVAEEPVLTRAERGSGFVQTTASVGRAFCMVGSGLNRSGGAIEWARGVLDPGGDRERLIGSARAVPAGGGGICFVPHLAYSSAPRPDTAARGAFVGLTEASGPPELFRAVLEGIAMEARAITDALATLPGVMAPTDVRVIGGGVRNALLLSIKAAVLARPLTVYDEPEMTGLGAAVLGGVAAGVWPTYAEALASLDLRSHRVMPDPDWTRRYAGIFEGVYRHLYDALRPLNHRLDALAKGG